MMATAVVACVPEEGPLMAAGQDCLRCHDGGDATRWTAAGTWSASGSSVTLADAAGKRITLRTNRVGNFYTAERLTFPLTATVEGATMGEPVTYGGCNRCHARGATDFGPLMAPGQDCLACHDGANANRFTLAGTFPSGSSVVVTDAAQKRLTLAINQVGNFFTEEPLTFPVRVSVGGATMEDPVVYGGCNRCHGPGGAGGD